MGHAHVVKSKLKAFCFQSDILSLNTVEWTVTSLIYSMHSAQALPNKMLPLLSEVVDVAPSKESKSDVVEL